MARRRADLPAGGMIPDALSGPRRRLEAVPDGPLRAVIYVRQSQKNEESISLELQEEINRGYCARQGHQVMAVVSDQVSGRKWDKRPGIREVMRMVADGEVDVVVLYRWSRISRRRLHQAQAIYLIEEEAGCRLESATEPFDTKTASGKFGRDQMLSFAAFQGDLIGEQWTEVHDRRRGDGLPHCGGKRFAYTVEGGQYRPDENLIEADRWRYEAYLAGWGMRAIAAELNSRGILNPHGRPWNETTIAHTMDSGFSAGLICQGSSEHRRTYLPGKHAPNLDGERGGPTWQAYLAMRAKRRTTPPRVIEPTYPLTGLVKCGDPHCGAALRVCSKKYPGKPSEPGYYYRCTNRLVPGVGQPVGITRTRLESEVLTWLRELAVDVDAGAAAHDATKRARLRAQVDVEQLVRQVATIDRQLTRLALQHASEEEMPEAVYAAARDELLGQRKTALTRLEAAKHEADQPAQPPRELSVSLLRDWSVLSVRHRRDVLAQLIRVILVTPAAQLHGPSTVEIIPSWAPAT